jgi:triphosphoribosyl-dephospho-CoA synthase
MNAARIAALATHCLLQEIETFPKPGLVSVADSGSHHDMDAGLLQRSAHALQPYFVELATAGARRSSLSQLQDIGRAAEATMLRVTGGVNTHRGAIFGLGLLCASAGLTGAGGTWCAPCAPGALAAAIGEYWGQALQTDAQRVADAMRADASADSHGMQVRRRYGAGGARAAAIGGFASLYQTALPALRRGRELAPGDENAARVQCCFALIAVTVDTNLLFRGGAEGLLRAQCMAREFIDTGGVGRADWFERAREVHRSFVQARLSPGGCADLLAMALFVEAWQRTAEVRSVQPDQVVA